MTLITKDGEYQTRSGAKVRIYATDGGGMYPVHGAFFQIDEWITRTWTAEGLCNRLMQSHPDDLIPVPKVRKLDYWVNVYRDGYHESHQTRGDADEFAKMIIRNRIACIHIEREVREGEGLE